MKVCSKCGVEKEVTAYSRHKRCKGGILSYCRLCDKIMSKKYYEKNKVELMIKAKQYVQNNIEPHSIYLQPKYEDFL